MKPIAVVRGAGDLATAAGRRLYLCGFSVAHLEIAQPTVIRRTVAFASAVFRGRVTVEGVEAVLAPDVAAARWLLEQGRVAVLIDPEAASIESLRPVLVVDAILAKRNLGTRLDMAPRVVALGPGFEAGVDVHAVVETCRGDDLGRVYTSGGARPDTGVPGTIGGVGAERVLRAPAEGTFRPAKDIGEMVQPQELVAEVDGVPLRSTIGGVLRGILHCGLPVLRGQKVADVDPRGDASLCLTTSDKANAVAGGVLEAAFRESAGRSLVTME